MEGHILALLARLEAALQRAEAQNQKLLEQLEAQSGDDHPNDP